VHAFCVLQGLAVLGHALAGLQLLPPEPWRLQYLAAARSCSLASTPAGCSYLIHTLAAWQAQDLRHSSISSSHASSFDQAAAEQPNPNAGGSKRTDHSLQQLLQALLQQCLQCFLQQGSGFTAEQLGMFCRGLAGLQLQGSPELAEQLEQVSSAAQECCTASYLGIRVDLALILGWLVLSEMVTGLTCNPYAERS
jgi:hypothetical protein